MIECITYWQILLHHFRRVERLVLWHINIYFWFKEFLQKKTQWCNSATQYLVVIIFYSVTCNWCLQVVLIENLVCLFGIKVSNNLCNAWIIFKIWVIITYCVSNESLFVNISTTNTDAILYWEAAVLTIYRCKVFIEIILKLFFWLVTVVV